MPELRKKKGDSKKRKRRKSVSEGDKWDKLYLSILELRDRQAETDEQIRELKGRQEEVTKQIMELIERQEEVTKQIMKLEEFQSRMQEENDRQIRELRKQVARVTDAWGRFVEGMVEPAAISYFRKKGFTTFEVHQRLKVSKNERNAEYDLLLVAPEHKTVMLVSAKTHVSSRDINELERDIKSLGFFLEYLKGYKVIGAVAGITFGRGADKYAYRKGFVVLKVSEDAFDILEPKKLKVSSLIP